MGAIGRLLGVRDAVRAVGQSATGGAGVFTPNRTKRMELSAAAYQAALAEAGAKFGSAGTGRFDRFVNGLNRLPRPMLTPGALELFAYAMADPGGFTTRMQWLAHVPQLLWCLLGAIVLFYFRAREAHYFRMGKVAVAAAGTPAAAASGMPPAGAALAGQASPDAAGLAADNPALDNWERPQVR